MAETPHTSGELEVNFKPETGRAVIEGKTVVPFQAFVTLVLQKKILPFTKTWGKHPVVIDSELLTSLASAPQDSRENISTMVLVSLIAGVLLGVAGLAAAEALFLFLQTPLGIKEHLVLLGSIALLVILLALFMKMQRMPRGEKLLETIESVSGFLSSKK